MSRRIFTALTALVTLAILSGCASYRWGTGSELAFESIFVKPASNDSFAPQAQALVSAQIREAFIRDGRVKIVTSEEKADAVLLVNLTDYARNPSARSSVDTEQARDFELKLTAVISLYDQANGGYHFERRMIEESTNAYTDNPFSDEVVDSYQQAEYQAMPRLARDLARKVADEVLSPW